MEYGRMFTRGNFGPPASEAQIRSFESSVGFALPKEYVDFLRWADGGFGFVGHAHVILWPLEDLGRKNKAYDVAEFAPGLFLFGSSGGGEAYAFDIRSPAMPIVEVPFIGMELKAAHFMAPTFNGFLEVLHSTNIDD